jgi:1,4-alpha-glucan branching enzyme
VLNTDDASFDGTGFAVETELATEDEPKHGFPQSLNLRLPPLAALVFAPVGASTTKKKTTKKAANPKAAPKPKAARKPKASAPGS